MFERFKRGDTSHEDAGVMEQEKPDTSEGVTEQARMPEPPSSSGSDIGISELMSKRAKLEEAIDYVGLMIKSLKDKRTKLEKEIEDESVDIKNLKEKLAKVGEYIDEENRGIHDLSNKRAQVEREADEVGALINSLRSKLANIDSIVEGEANKVKNIKDSRPKA